jgi:hypothetical protein
MRSSSRVRVVRPDRIECSSHCGPTMPMMSMRWWTSALRRSLASTFLVSSLSCVNRSGDERLEGEGTAGPHTASTETIGEDAAESTTDASAENVDKGCYELIAGTDWQGWIDDPCDAHRTQSECDADSACLSIHGTPIACIGATSCVHGEDGSRFLGCITLRSCDPQPAVYCQELPGYRLTYLGQQGNCTPPRYSQCSWIEPKPIDSDLDPCP